MEITSVADLASLAIVGAVVSVVVQIVKSTVGTSRTQTVAVVVGLSLLAGAGYYQFNNTALWDASIQILLYANFVYGFLIKPFQD